MADLTVTVASVNWLGGAAPVRVTAGATITRGMVVYRDTADGEYKKADANTVGLATVGGIALTDGYDGMPMLIAPDGAQINIGATTTAGLQYTLTSTDAATANGSAGGIVSIASLGAGDYTRPLFVGSGTGIVTLVFNNNGAVKP